MRRPRRRLVKSAHVASPGPVRIPVRIPVRMRVTAGLAATAVVVVVAGCATVPSGSAPQLVQTGGDQVQPYALQLPPPGPKAYHKPRDVVLGFLHASASYAFDPAAARQFLLPTLQASWHPGPVTVVRSIGKTTTNHPVRPQLDASSAEGQTDSVEFTSQRLATLSQTGQYQYSPRTSTYLFSVQKQANGVWLISALPPGLQDSLLLIQADFESVYQARNLFFFARPQSPPPSNLVPDPVYAPLQSSNTNLASGLVKGLLSDQNSWLSPATETAFPHGTILRGITITGQTAVVDLGGAAARASPNQQQDMAWQLQATLSSTAYSPALARLVQLEINGRTTDIYPFPQDLIGPVPRGPLVYQSGPGTISEGLGSHPSLGPAEFGSAGITAIAMNPAPAPQAGQVAVAAKDGNGCQLYVQAANQDGRSTAPNNVPLSTSGGDCTSLSWDNNGYLWAAAGQKIWALRAPYSRAVPVALHAHLPSSSHRAPQIIALRMAPDAVRAALLIRSGTHNRLLLAAVREDRNQVSLGGAVPAGTGLHDPTAMSWFSPYDLVVLDDSAIAEVPLAGGAAERLGSAPPGAMSLTTNGVTIVVGTLDHSGDHEIWTSSTMAVTWNKPVTGAIPIYPG